MYNRKPCPVSVHGSASFLGATRPRFYTWCFCIGLDLIPIDRLTMPRFDAPF